MRSIDRPYKRHQHSIRSHFNWSLLFRQENWLETIRNGKQHLHFLWWRSQWLCVIWRTFEHVLALHKQKTNRHHFTVNIKCLLKLSLLHLFNGVLTHLMLFFSLALFFWSHKWLLLPIWVDVVFLLPSKLVFNWITQTVIKTLHLYFFMTHGCFFPKYTWILSAFNSVYWLRHNNLIWQMNTWNWKKFTRFARIN